MHTINNIPCYEAIFTDDQQGMICISLVDCPATEVDFQAFAAEKLHKYAVIDEDKHIVRGLIMAADMPIYRFDEKLGEYYIIHSADFLRNMAERYFKEGNQNNMDTMHNFQFEEGCDMVQFYIKDTANGIAPAGYDDIADGSLFGEFHITNEDIWGKIKSGEYKGFSIAAYYDIQPVDNNSKKNTNKMSKITRFVTALMKFGEMETVDGKKIFWNGEDALKEGDEVYVEDEEGNKLPAPDGEYEADGKLISIVAGLVESIKDKEEEPAEPVAEPEANATFSAKKHIFEESYNDIFVAIQNALNEAGLDAYVIDAGEGFAIVGIWEENGEKVYRYEVTINEEGVAILGEREEVKNEWVPVNEPAAEPVAMAEDDEKDARIAELEAAVAEKDAKIAELEAKIADLEKEPAAEDPAKEYEKQTEVKVTGNAKLDRAIARAKAFGDSRK